MRRGVASRSVLRAGATHQPEPVQIGDAGPHLVGGGAQCGHLGRVEAVRDDLRDSSASEARRDADVDAVDAELAREAAAIGSTAPSSRRIARTISSTAALGAQ